MTCVRSVVLLAAMALALTGCAAASGSDNGDADFESVPTGAEVRAQYVSCTTPCHLGAASRQEFEVTVSKPGYKPQTIRVTSRRSLAGEAQSARNDFGASLFGFGFEDPAKRGFEYDPNPVIVHLVPVTPAPRKPAS